MPVLIFIAIAFIFYTLSQGGQATGIASLLAPPSQFTNNDSGVMMHKSDTSLTGSEITSNVNSWPGGDKVWDICTAIALAEGFNNGEGCAPYDLNNPGDLSPGDESSQATCGGAQFHGGSSIILFCTAEGGFKALYVKINNMVTGRSHTYPSTLTWNEVAQKYAGNWQNWVKNVTDYLGVDPNTTPADYVNNVTV